MSVNSHNHIKVGTSTKNSKVVGGFSFGVTGGDDYGPTTTSITGGTGTGFYNGITPPAGGYTIYSIVGGNIYANVANNDTEGMFYLQSLGATGTTISEMLAWAEGNSSVIARPAEYTLSDLPGASQATTGQTSLLITTVDGSPNWHYVIFDFTNNLITTPYDMGAVVSDYENSNYIDSTENAGYLVTLHSTNDWNTQKHYFISANGVLVESYDTTGSTDSSTDFIAQYLQDYNNSILKYFDGIHVYTRDYSTLGYNLYVSYNYDLGGSDGGILTYWDDGTTGYIENNYQGNVILLKSYNINAYNIDPQSYVMSNYTFLIQQHRSGDYYRMDIVDNQTGNLLQRIPLDDYSYQGYNLDFYGTGKGIVLFYSYGDTSVPWRLINYDGVTDTLIVTDQPNDGNYNDYYIIYTTDYPYLDDGNPSESAFVEFFTYRFNLYNNFIYLNGYYKTYSFYDGCSTPNIYTLNDTGTLDKGVSYNNSQVSNHFYRLISTGLTTLEIAILGGPTDQIIETDIVVYDNAGNGGMDDANTSIMGDNLFMMTFSGNSTNASTAYVFGKISGNTYGMRASLSLDNNNYDYWRGNDFVYLIDFGNSQAWYFNDAVSGFTQVDYLSNIGSSNTNYAYRPPNFERRPTYVFYSRDTFDAYVLTKNSISPKVTLEPNNGNYEFEIGDSGLMYIYNNTSDGTVVIDIYNLSMTRTQRITTTEYSLNSYYIIGNRYIVETSDVSGNKVYYRITPTTHESITLPSNGYDNGPTANDPVA